MAMGEEPDPWQIISMFNQLCHLQNFLDDLKTIDNIKAILRQNANADGA
jgi:hypothetical protein